MADTSEAAVAERLRIAAILNACLPDGADPLTPAILKALAAFWDTWWNKVATLEGDPGHSLITDEDLNALSEAAEAVESLLYAPVDDDEDDQRLALAALAGDADPAAMLPHAIAALAHSDDGVRLWMLDCGNLVQKHRERAEAAEAKLAAIESASRDHLGREGDCCPHFAEDVLATIGGEETRDLTSAEAKAIADAERIEAAAAVLERRYPAARPEQLDTTITELHSVARAWRRMAGEASYAGQDGCPIEAVLPSETISCTLRRGHDGYHSWDSRAAQARMQDAQKTGSEEGSNDRDHG